MTIRDYFKNYSSLSTYPSYLSDGEAQTIQELYDGLISKHLLPRDNALAWHDMLVKYSARPDAVLWIRGNEKGAFLNGRYTNRRAAVTRYDDGFSYVFVSNYDAQEILNMIRLGVTPDIDKFAAMMSNFEYCFHYDEGKSSEESDIAAYPHIGDVRHGVLAKGLRGFYLAHINGVKGDYVFPNGKVVRFAERGGAFGQEVLKPDALSRWTPDPISGKRIRFVQGQLSNEEKAVMRACFLRFVDPLNYYVVASDKFEDNTLKSRIADASELNAFMAEKQYDFYPKNVVDEFRALALIPAWPKGSFGKTQINMRYGPKIKAKHVASKATPKATKGKTRPTVNAPSSIRAIMGMSMGAYAQRVFAYLDSSGQLSKDVALKLCDLSYCKANFGAGFPIFLDRSSGADASRYYSNLTIAGKYALSAQWYDRHYPRLIAWLSAQGYQLP